MSKRSNTRGFHCLTQSETMRLCYFSRPKLFNKPSFFDRQGYTYANAHSSKTDISCAYPRFYGSRHFSVGEITYRADLMKREVDIRDSKQLSNSVSEYSYSRRPQTRMIRQAHLQYPLERFSSSISRPHPPPFAGSKRARPDLAKLIRTSSLVLATKSGSWGAERNVPAGHTPRLRTNRDDCGKTGSSGKLHRTR